MNKALDESRYNIEPLYSNRQPININVRWCSFPERKKKLKLIILHSQHKLVKIATKQTLIKCTLLTLLFSRIKTTTTRALI